MHCAMTRGKVTVRGLKLFNAQYKEVGSIQVAKSGSLLRNG